MAVEEVIIKFVADTTGLKPAIDTLKALGQISEEDAAKIELVNKATNQATASINKEAQAMGGLTQEAQQLFATITEEVLAGVADGLHDWAKETGAVTKQSKSLKQELKELKQQIGSGQFSGKELKEMTKRAAELTDTIGDVNEKIKALSSDTKRIDAVVGAFRGLAAAGSIAQGAVGLLGQNNEHLQESLLKVQSAMAILTGVQELANLATGEGIVKTLLLDGAQKAAAISSRALGVTISASMAAATAGLSLLVAGLAYFIVTMNDSKDEAEEFIETLNRIGNTSEALQLRYKLNLNLLSDRLKAETELKVKWEVEELKRTNKFNADVLKVETAYDDLSLYQRTVQLETKNAKLAELNKDFESDIKLIKENGAKESNDLQAKYDKQAEDNAKAAREKSAREYEKWLRDRQKRIDEVGKMELLTHHELGIRRLEIAKMNNELLSMQGSSFEAAQLQAAKDFNISQEQLMSEFYASGIEKFEDFLKAKEQKARESEKIQQQLIQETFKVFDALSNAAFTIDRNNRQAATDYAISEVQRQSEALLLNEDLTAKQRAQIKKREEREIAKIKTDAWKAQQNADVASAIINGALAVTKTLASVAYPANLIAAASVAALTGIEIAAIESRPVPKFAKGTKFVEGPGTGTSDSIPAFLSRGEGVDKADVNRDYFTAFNIMRDRKVPPSLANNIMESLAYNGGLALSDWDDTITQSASEGHQELDYEKLGREMGKHATKVTVSVDENGIKTLLEKHNSHITYVNRKFRHNS